MVCGRGKVLTWGMSGTEIVSNAMIFRDEQSTHLRPCRAGLNGMYSRRSRRLQLGAKDTAVHARPARDMVPSANTSRKHSRGFRECNDVPRGAWAHAP